MQSLTALVSACSNFIWGVPMLVMLACWCIIRVTYITITVKLIPDIRVIFWAYPLTWTLSSIVFFIYFLKSDWIHAFEKSRNRI